MRTAVLGMGRMGAALAQRLVGGGHEVTIWNRSPGKAGRLVEMGALEAGSVGDATARAEIVLTSLSDDPAVRAVALGPGGLRENLKDSVAYVETSTVSPELTEELAGIFPSFAAMPVLGGPAAVEKGQATYLLGGGEATRAVLEPVLASLGGPVRTYSSPGLASTAKLATNLMLLSGLVALTESFAVGRSGGLSDADLHELLGGAVAPGLKNRFEVLLSGEGSGWWTTALGAKDAGLAIDVAKGGGYDLPLAVTARDVYLHAAAAGFSAQDIAAIRNLYFS